MTHGQKNIKIYLCNKCTFVGVMNNFFSFVLLKKLSHILYLEEAESLLEKKQVHS